MADVNEEDGALKPNSTPEEAATPMLLTPATISPTPKDEGNTMVETEINQEQNKQDSLTDEAQPDAVTEKDEDKTEKQIKGENLGGVLKGKGSKPRKRFKKKKVAKKDNEIVSGNQNEGNVIVAANNGLTKNEEQVKEIALGEEETIGVDENKLPESSNGRGRKPKRKRMKKVAQKGSTDMAVVDVDKPESSNKKKGLKRVESMGMVFMCSSKTKADCFQYKILGLPKGKKDQVARIYKGMRLFLFDVDLRLMYGIYKAAEAGGYNLEPKAFKSAFPSQVRFTVMEDCLPLAEEKFKNVIKENYYSRNKFKGQLNSQQVKKLCKLLAARKSGPSPKKAIKSHQNRADAYTSRGKRRAQEEEGRPRDQRRYHEYGQPPIRHQREAFRSPVQPVARYLPPPLLLQEVAAPVRSYGYEGAYSYGRDQLYSREAPIYRDNVYPSVEQMVEYHHHHQLSPPAVTLPPQYHLVGREYPLPPVVQPEEYHLSRGLQVRGYRDVGNTSDYFSSSASVPEYRSHQTRYGY